MSFRKLPLILFAAFTLAARPAALACATCYGASDAPLARGMNWGIITLLGVVGLVLFGITAFFVHLGIKSARLQADAPAGRDDGPARLPHQSDSKP